ncbi:MAG: Flp pilus assembly complex ATPase component TadA, partial [Candidatus Omnitrophica bacterium]|nr:Flp pilus assembly complex ATPase component TadA [Candidatus Omnitrophota bacterium]
MAKKTNIDFLLSKGIITQDQIKRAKEEAEKTGLPLEKALDRLGFISEVDIAKAISESTGIPFMDLSDYLIDSEVITLIPEATARKCKTIPLFKIGDSLTVAMADPQDVAAIDEVRKKSKAGAIEPVLSTHDMISKAIDEYYGALGDTKKLMEGLTKEKVQGLAQAAEQAPVIKLVNLIIIQAVKDRASDIHVEPQEDKLLVRYRIDGMLHEAQEIPKHLQSALLSRFKVMAKMDIAENRLPQDGRIRLKMESKDLDLRVSSFPTVYGENLVLRLLDKSSVLLGLAELGFSIGDLKNFDK